MTSTQTPSTLTVSVRLFPEEKEALDQLVNLMRKTNPHVSQSHVIRMALMIYHSNMIIRPQDLTKPD